MKTKPIELIEGYEVYHSKQQLDAAITSIKERPTRVMRIFLGIFTNEVLASSSAVGPRNKKVKIC